MKTKSFLLIFLSILSIGYANNFSQNLLNEKTCDVSVVRELLSDFHFSIDRCTEDKIYIHSEHIKSTNLGIVLSENGKTLQLPIVFSDHYGAYIYMDENIQPVSIVVCLGCGKYRFSGDRCRTPGCPLNK
jgi:hypothetical protein